jgi:ABC-type branched-subunit amino acid transport system substrate-binding protein
MTIALRPIAASLALAAFVAGSAAAADKQYAPGITDTAIKFGQTLPLSGPASAYSQVGRAEAAYFHMINDQGGVNGRKLDLIMLDDGYSPPKTVEQTRKLVEEEKVAFLFSSVGTPTNMSVRAYLNQHKVPQLWIGSGSSKFDDPKHFPWTMAFLPSYLVEGRIYARYLLATKPDAKAAVLYQNDDFGKDLLQGFREGFGADADKRIVATASYEVTDPTIDQQIVSLQGSGADVFFAIVTPKFSAQALRKVSDLGWKPLYIVDYVGSSVAAALKPAGLEKAVGMISTAYVKDPTDPQWQNDADYKAWRAWMAKYMPDGDLDNAFNAEGYVEAEALVHILKACGDDLTRENIMAQATHLTKLALPMVESGITMNTTPDDYVPVKEMRLVRFDGKTWVSFGDTIDGRLSQR